MSRTGSEWWWCVFSPQTSITRSGCGVSKLCVSAPSNCDPAGTSSCFFSSVQVKGQSFFVELSGKTAGYVALGLAKAVRLEILVINVIINSFFLNYCL